MKGSGHGPVIGKLPNPMKGKFNEVNCTNDYCKQEGIGVIKNGVNITVEKCT